MANIKQVAIVGGTHGNELSGMSKATGSKAPTLGGFVDEGDEEEDEED